MVVLELSAAFLLSVVLTGVFLKYGRKRLLVEPNQRSAHTVPTPRGGGIAPAVVFLFFICLEIFSGSTRFDMHQSETLGLVLGLFSVWFVILGFWEDHKQIRWSLRLLIQAGLIISFLFFFRLELIIVMHIWFSQEWLIYPAAFIFVLWMVNLYNFMDGIDGMAASQIVFGTMGLLVLSPSVPKAVVLLAFCFLGFLYWNWHVARVFMGDIGSLFLGFIVGVLIVYSKPIFGLMTSTVTLLFLPFLLDTTVTVIRRMIHKKSPMIPHREFYFHRLVRSGLSHNQVVWIYMGVNLITLPFAYLHQNISISQSPPTAVYGFGIYLLGTIPTALLFYWIEKRKPMDRNAFGVRDD